MQDVRKQHNELTDNELTNAPINAIERSKAAKTTPMTAPIEISCSFNLFAPTFADSFTSDDVLKSVCMGVLTEAAVGVTCVIVPAVEIVKEEGTSLVRNEVDFEESTCWTEADNCGVTLISVFSEVDMEEKVDAATVVVIVTKFEGLGLCVLPVMDLRMSIEETNIILLCSAVLDCTICVAGNDGPLV